MHKVRLAVRLTAAVAALAPLLVASPVGATSRYLTYWGDYGTDSLVIQTLTPQGTDDYVIGKTTVNHIGDVYMNANATNTGNNLRKVFWPAGAGNYLNSESCATWWSSSAESVQEGLALRIVDAPTGTRALTVTKNVVYGIHWVFNVHTWDTTRAQPFEQVAQFDMASAVTVNGQLKPKPWRACARVSGEQIQFKIWFPFQGQAEPTWEDPVYARTATVPAEWSQAGKTGWYVGHLAPGQAARYNGLTTYMYQ